MRESGVALKTKRPTAMVGLRGVANWVAEHELWLLVTAIPLLMFPEFVPFPLTGVSVVLVLIPWLCRWLAKGYLSVRTPMDMPILGLFIMLPVSLWASVDLNLSLVSLYQIIASVGLFYGLANSLSSIGQVRRAITFLIAIGAGMALVAPVATKWFTHKLFPLPQIYQRIPLLVKDPVHPNVLAGALGMIIPIPLALLFLGGQDHPADAELRAQPLNPRHKIQKFGLWILNAPLFRTFTLAIMLITFILTQSRGAFLALALGILFIGIQRNRWLVLSVPIVAIGLLIAIWHLGAEGLTDFLLITDTIGGWQGRKEVWSRAIYMIQDFPYTGIGLRTFSRVGPVMYPYFLLGPDADVPHAHNLFLQVAVDLGIPGFVAFVASITVSMVMAWQAFHIFKSKGERDRQSLALGLLCSFLVMMVHGLVDCVTWGSKPAIIPWIMMGLTVTLYNIAKQPLELDIHS